MDIKELVIDICNIKINNRAGFIANYLRENNIYFNTIKYSYGVNIEIYKKGINTDKEIIFMSHYDIFKNITQGANDNTSSVAVLLNLSKFLYFYKPYYSTRIIFNDNEEILGALLFNKLSNNEKLEIINKVGSYQYLKNIIKSNRILAVFILELSGIGDALYFADKSGDSLCNGNINNYLSDLALQNKLNYLNIPIASSDMISVNLLGLKGTVIGAIPYVEGQNYLNDIKINGINKEIYPHVWKKNHTEMDNYFSIQEKSLDMIYNFLIKIVEELNKLENYL